MKLTAVIYPGEMEDVFVAYNPETGTTTQGTDREDALEPARGYHPIRGGVSGVG
jgi:predicted RNase H-like HicB family nuclease